MENKDNKQAKSPWAMELERSPSFRAVFTYISHRFDSKNKWVNCKTDRNSFILFNVAYATDKVEELGVEKDERVVVTFKAVNRDGDRPSSYRFTIVDIEKYVEEKEDEEVSSLLDEERNFYEMKRGYFQKTLSSHRGTFKRAVQDKRGERCELFFDMKVRLEDGQEVATTMAFRSFCRDYYDLGFQGREGKDFRLWVNPGKTCIFFTEDGEDNVIFEEKGEDVSRRYFSALFLEAAEQVEE